MYPRDFLERRASRRDLDSGRNSGARDGSLLLPSSIIFRPADFLVPISLSHGLAARKRRARSRERVITLYGTSIHARVSLSGSRHRRFQLKREHLPRDPLRRLRRDRSYIPKPRNAGVRGFTSRRGEPFLSNLSRI